MYKLNDNITILNLQDLFYLDRIDLKNGVKVSNKCIFEIYEGLSKEDKEKLETLLSNKATN